jgi:hypothetical protein
MGKFINCPNKYLQQHEAARARDGWLSTVSVSDWCWMFSDHPNYTSPFHMQGCLYA